MVAAKLRRLREAADITINHTVGWAARRKIMGCYANLGSALTDDSTLDVHLRCGPARLPCRMRRSDVFTLAEIFHERQYDIRTALPEAPLVVDGGANIGLASLWLAGRYPGAVVHAFEPEPANFELLRLNLASLPGARANRVALGNEDGEIRLQLSDHAAMHSTTPDAPGGRGIPVVASRLDSYLDAQEIRRVDLLKLDVEGAELDVVEGLGSRLKDVGVIIGEVHETAVDVDAFYEHLRRNGLSEIRRIAFRDGAAQRVHGFEARRP